MAIIKEFSKEAKKSDVLMMASDIVSNRDAQIVVLYSRPESGKTAVREYNYEFDGWDYKKTTHWYYKTSSGFRSSMSDYPLNLEEMISDIMEFLEGDLEEGESIEVFLEER